MKFSVFFMGILGLGSVLVFGEGRPEFNDREIPRNLDDLREIQRALQENLERTRAATVCLQIGGASGSAVVVSEDGLVLTAAHVTGGVGKEIDVVFEDGTKVKGRSLGLNSETDSAMLQLEGEGPFPFVEVDMDDTTKLGDWVFALGHSGGFDESRGVNVRLGRLVRQADRTVQSDCILIGGDSGGPLFNMAGQLVGIHSRVGASRVESMHVPIREFKARWEELKGGEFLGEGPFAQKKEEGSGFLGLKLGEGDESGKVEGLWEEGPAAEAGLKEGDVILEIDGEEFSKELFEEKMSKFAEGEKVTLKWKSGEEEIEKEIELSARP